MIEDVICNRLLEDSGVTALVGDRVYPVVSEQNPVYPFVVFAITTNEPLAETLGGVSVPKHQLDVTVKCVSQNFTPALDVSKAVKAALHDWKASPVHRSKLTLAECQFIEGDNTFEYDLSFTIMASV